MDISPHQVYFLGQAARDWLSFDQHGKVLAAVTKATYLLTEGQELVWLAAAETPMHRRCIQVPSPLPRWTADSVFTVKDQFIELGPGSGIDLGSLQVWEAPILPVGDLIEIKSLPEKLEGVCHTFLSKKAPVGFGRLIQPILQIAKKQDHAPGILQDNTMIKLAWPIIENITRTCLSHNFTHVLQQADAMIGFGAGLTPSGDDFLGGLFFGRYLLSCYYPQLFYLEYDNLPNWIDAHGPHTNLISFALLKDNALGYASEPLSRFGAALLTNPSIQCAKTAALELTAVGHSTGWDLLTGFLAGMLLAFEG